MSAAPRSRQFWPMKWVVLAIVLVIVPYTFITLHYRKPGRAFEPYHDMKDRANTLRLLSAGFQRVTLEADRPADPARSLPSAPLFPAPGGLPAALDATLVEKPLLPDQILSVRAAATAGAAKPYPVELTCSLTDNKRQLGGAQLYVRSEEIVIVPAFEALAGGLLARTRESDIRLTVPAGTLKPGRYHVTLVGARVSKAWQLDVK